MATLECKEIIKDFGGLRAIDRLDFRVQSGDIFGLIGPNGSGKTTVLNVITGTLRASSGEVIYDGRDSGRIECARRCGQCASHRIAGCGIIRTFQITSLFSNLTTEQNILHAMHLRNKSTFLGALFNTRGYRNHEREQLKKANDILAFLGLDGKRGIQSKNLSPAEQRHLEIGIGLAAEPRLLLLDEPAAGLNPEECLRLIRIIKSIQEQGITIIVVEHNMKVIMNLCTRVLVINYGRKVMEGTTDEVSCNDEVVSIYLGAHKNA